MFSFIYENCSYINKKKIFLFLRLDCSALFIDVIKVAFAKT